MCKRVAINEWNLVYDLPRLLKGMRLHRKNAKKCSSSERSVFNNSVGSTMVLVNSYHFGYCGELRRPDYGTISESNRLSRMI